ncbi:MAG: VWA domain-containing protein [Pseudomonadota bacterium]
MTTVFPFASSVFAALAAGLTTLVVVAYVLKLHRRRFEVPFAKLWQRVLGERESSTLWRRLRRFLSLLLQLAILFLLLCAALDPKLGTTGATRRHVAIVVDASASMQTREHGTDRRAGPRREDRYHAGGGGGGNVDGDSAGAGAGAGAGHLAAATRLEQAKGKARELIERLGEGDAAIVFQMDSQATALSRLETDRPRLVEAIDRIEASDTRANLRRSLAAAADALRDRERPLIVVIGDGAYLLSELGEVDLAGLEVRFIPVGKTGRNVGLTAFSVRRYQKNRLSYEALVEVANFGDSPEETKLSLVAVELVDTKSFVLAAGESRREIYSNLGGSSGWALEARVELGAGADPFPLDDRAFATIPERPERRVLLVSESNLYLEGALLADSSVSVDRLGPAEYENTGSELPNYDVVVLDGCAPTRPLPAPAAVFFGPPQEKSPFAVRRSLERPVITSIDEDHPITRWVSLADINIDRSLVFVPAAGDVIVAQSIHDPLIVAGRRNGKRLVAFGFDLASTDLVLRVAFPVLLLNTFEWFAGQGNELATAYQTGRLWTIPVDLAEESPGASGILSDGGSALVEIDGPRGRFLAPAANGRVRFYGRHTGFYQINTRRGAATRIAANLSDPVESRIEPRPVLVLGGKELAGSPSLTPSLARSIWPYLALAGLLLATVEWLSYHRRATV